MDLKEVMIKRPAAKQAVRFDAQGRIEVSHGDGVVPPKDIIRLNDATSLLGRHLGLGQSRGFAISGDALALVVVATGKSSLGIVESVGLKDDLAAREAQVRAMISPTDASVVRMSHGFLEVKR